MRHEYSVWKISLHSVPIKNMHILDRVEIFTHIKWTFMHFIMFLIGFCFLKSWRFGIPLFLFRHFGCLLFNVYSWKSWHVFACRGCTSEGNPAFWNHSAMIKSDLQFVMCIDFTFQITCFFLFVFKLSVSLSF